MVWTWSGKFFGSIEKGNFWTYDGRHVGKLVCGEIFDRNGYYLGELRENRLITPLESRQNSALLSSRTPHAPDIFRARNMSVIRWIQAIKIFPLRMSCDCNCRTTYITRLYVLWGWIRVRFKVVSKSKSSRFIGVVIIRAALPSRIMSSA